MKKTPKLFFYYAYHYTIRELWMYWCNNNFTLPEVLLEFNCVSATDIYDAKKQLENYDGFLKFANEDYNS